LSALGRVIGFLAFLGPVVIPPLTAADPLIQCKHRLWVLDRLGEPIGQVIGERDGSCLVKSRDGRLQRWVPMGELSAAPPEEPIASKRTVEPEASETEPAPPQPEEIDTAGLYPEWLPGLATTRFHGRHPFAGKQPGLRRSRFRQSRESVFPTAPAPRSVPAARPAEPRGIGSLRMGGHMGFR